MTITRFIYINLTKKGEKMVNQITFKTEKKAKSYFKAMKSIAFGWAYSRKGRTVFRKRSIVGKLLDLQYKRNG